PTTRPSPSASRSPADAASGSVVRRERPGTNPGTSRPGHGAAGRVLPGFAVGGGPRVRRDRGRAARLDRGEPGVGTGSESAGAGGCAERAARADPALASDAVAGEGEPARAGGGVLRPLSRPAGGGHAQAGRAVVGAGLSGRSG